MPHFCSMINAPTPHAEQQQANRYVDGLKLLETLFQPECRPSLRWLRAHQREFPNMRIGRLIFFDPVLVKAHLDAKRKGVK
jgi:hypothetical protein